MKTKRIVSIILILLIMVSLIGCSKGTKEVRIYKDCSSFLYDSIYESLILTDKNANKFLNSFKTQNKQEVDLKIDETNRYLFIAKYNNETLMFIDYNNVVVVNDGETKFYTSNEDYTFLNQYAFNMKKENDFSSYNLDTVTVILDDSTFYNFNKNLLNEQLKKLKFIKIEKDMNLNNSLFKLNFDNKEIIVYDEHIFKTNNNYYYIINGSFSLLTKITFETCNPLVPKEDNLEKIEITRLINHSQCEIEDLNEYLSCVASLECFKVDYYLLESKKLYSIKYGDEVIYICENNVAIVDNKYYVILQDFMDYFNKLDYNDSGWLPWI